MSEDSREAQTAGPWILMGSLDAGPRLWSVPITSLPFRVGRSPGLELTLHSQAVSTEHAEIYVGEASLRVRDLNSTNGTFVNRRRITDGAIRDGDVLHFADFEFRLAREAESATRPRGTAVLEDIPLPERFVGGTEELGELLRDGAVTTHFQPIVELPGGAVIGHEALGRGLHGRLPAGPIQLFRIAESLGSEVSLSQLFRTKALAQAKTRPNLKVLFINTHPAELLKPDLMTSLETLPASAPGIHITIEVHEAAIVNVAHVANLRARLSELGMGLAYDDFGSGQARLLELAEVPPDYLKFDIRFVRQIDRAPESKRRLVRSLVAAALDLGVKVLAEGIETSGEAGVCAELGFTHAQGFYFAEPIPFDRL